MQPVATLVVGIGIVLLGVLWLRLHAFLALLLAAFAVAGLTSRGTLRESAEAKVDDGSWTAERAEAFAGSTAADRVVEGFGETASGIGILIALAAIIGKCLLDSGAADRIVRSALELVGQGRAALAFLGSGFLLAVPVFFDTVFYLLIPLGKAAARQSGRDYLLYVLAIVAGATMAHSLVPPTPGPLLVAEALGVDLLTMALGGAVVGLFAALAGFTFARILNHRMPISLRDPGEAPALRIEPATAPPLWLAILPIALPFALIALAAVPESSVGSFGVVIRTLGDKNVALAIGAAVALGTLAWSARVDRRGLAEATRSALAGAGVIILITSAGGAFGSSIRQSGVAEAIERLAGGGAPAFVLPLAFLVTALIRTAQGSATVAMITAVGVLAPLAEADRLGCHPVYLALAIGCGSKPISWMPDSGFWVICQMSGLTESQGLRTVTPMTAVMGLAGLLATLLGAWLLPLA